MNLKVRCCDQLTKLTQQSDRGEILIKIRVWSRTCLLCFSWPPTNSDTNEDRELRDNVADVVPVPEHVEGQKKFQEFSRFEWTSRTDSKPL